MAIIIPFPRLSETVVHQEWPADIPGSGSADLTTLIDQLQSDLASIRAYFVTMQRDRDLLVSAEKNA